MAAEPAFDGEIHVLPYTHADIAWVHTRAWHVDRYVRALDEVLERFDQDPDYHYYVDTWIELMEPYLKHRPHRAADVARHLRSGRLAVCGGQFGNVRSTAVGDETQVRNLQLGRRRWQALVPEWEPTVHSNIDVTFGHTQMPQLLALAGIEAYFVMRPIAALDAQGVPRTFLWRGLSGREILMVRDTGVGLFQERERFGPTWESDWPAVRRHLWETHLGAPARDGVPAIALSVGVDDSRPERFAFNDVPADYAALIRAWNARETGRMRYGTPDTLVARLREARASLPVVDTVLDPTCVHFNIALHGRRGIWWLREQADRRLVDAEALGALARLSGAAEHFPEARLTAEWERLLTWTPHAVQWLFRDDWREGERALLETVAQAEALGAEAARALAGGCLPVDAAGVALVNPVPAPAREVVPLWIVNSDLTRAFAGLTDHAGRDVPVQVVDFPVPGAEVEVLAQADVPGCGVAPLRIRWEPTPAGVEYPGFVAHLKTRYGLAPRVVVPGGACVLASDRVRLTLVDGHVVSVVCDGREVSAPEGASFLEPLCASVERTDWCSNAVAEDPERFVARETRIDERGPLRWRVTRTGTAGGFWVRQQLDLVRGEGAVRSTLQFLDPAEPCDALIGIGVPCGDAADFETDIPFGVEPRPVDRIRYGISERAIPGLFWGRTWVRAAGGGWRWALLAEDGDRLFRVAGTPRRLTHYLAQKMRVFEDGWEARIDTHDVGGRQVFHHRLLLEGDAERDALVACAERVRHPLTACDVPEARLGPPTSLLEVGPPSVRLSALLWDGDDLVARLVQMGDAAVEARVSLARPVASAARVDLRGRETGAAARCDGSAVTTTLGPWEIATLRIRPA